MKLEARDFEKEQFEIREVKCCICGEKGDIEEFFNDGINHFCGLCINTETWREDEK